ncbi:hypothetical protein A2368_00565 [Candidatus Collierbacteria bacterium RIFOXYB1_FULL_49_13]|uniref:Uncharacterized protein n=1 Tax=Candidatus Collierbacteria bacterium RIFOXYB1_FULL_49_13 TaxID=1817728 RepID=A0A1F5FHH3_9BACT|nr:MAG: hypothetical protein A2368_00565 [Candidatus Collierbacteria bacterium RIFOXYB1_FULL_49_13]
MIWFYDGIIYDLPLPFAVVVILSLIVALFGLVLYGLADTPRVKRLAFWGIALSVALGPVGTLVLGYAWYRFDK